ncbi:carbohydrate sulfotransferase 5 [Leptinotarsa decemlineata]|uniref:carbohydrate sulfotransferase 5 n=1 Tax=Leptinotarsa decemlineata TaxID=7539 RepID=UPI003D305DA8
MVRRNEIFGISIVALLCLLLIAFSQKETTNYRRSPKYQQLIDLEESFRVSNNFTVPTPTIQDVISMQRNLLLSELHDYQFPEGDNLEDYTLFTGGQPVRTIIITTWRSGSTFLGDIINSLPGNYYHYEPLLEYGIMQIRGSPHAETALQTLRRLLNCDYTSLYSYLEYGMSHVYLFTHNTRLWNQCEMYPQYCWNYTFLNEMCRLFPFQSMKTVRLRLWLAESLLEDEDLNVKVILLVRDPRGTLQSRKHRDWCPGEPDCDQPNNLCADMVSDYSAAIQLMKNYPDRFRALRYEDLSLNPEEIVEDLFDFLGLYFHRDVKRFIDSHTRINVGGVSSTFRDSKNAPFHWRMDLNYTEVQYIEENCDEAMKLWGYVRSKNASSMREFNPLTAYDIK